MTYEIRHIKRNEWNMAMQLAWDTFLIYEAPDYNDEGIKNFHEFVKGDELRNMFVLGDYYALGAFDENDVIIGILGIRKHWHISLLFVDGAFHHQGIATQLLRTAFTDATAEGVEEMTVFSAPFAVDFYHKLGFTDLDEEKTADGIRYTPMKIELV